MYSHGLDFHFPACCFGILTFHDRFRHELQVMQTVLWLVKRGDDVDASLKDASWCSVLHCKELVENVLDIAKPVMNLQRTFVV